MNLSSAIAAPAQFSAIPLNVSVQRLSSKGESVKLSGAIDMQAIQFGQGGQERDGAVDIWVVQEDKTGLVVGQSRDTLTLRLAAAEYANWLRSGLHFVKTIEALHAAASLRILVEDDATARIGSVIIPLDQVK